MKILFLCKRRPQGRDLLIRPYGRFFHLPQLLARKGHEVVMLLSSYQQDPPTIVEQGSITWLSENIRSTGPYSYFQRVRELVRTIRPDRIVGFSDTYFGILAEFIGRKFGIRSAIDAYDNYESYIPWFSPLHLLWRRALHGAAVVTAAGPQLAELLRNSRPGKPVHIVPMAADPGFLPMNRDECRKRMGLPLEERLIGYCGAVSRSRGIDLLFDAYEELRRKRPETRIVLSGRKDRSIRLPDNVRWLGYLPDEDIPVLLNAMDVFAVISRVSAFGRFSYPVKLYEAMACRIPVAATATEPAIWILKNQSAFLACPGDPFDLGRKLEHQLMMGRMNYGEVNTWEKSADKFEAALLADN